MLTSKWVGDGTTGWRFAADIQVVGLLELGEVQSAVWEPAELCESDIAIRAESTSHYILLLSVLLRDCY